MMGGPMTSGAPGMMMGGPSGILPRGDGMMMAGPSGPTSMYYPPGHPMAVAAGVERRPEQIEQEVRRARGPPTHTAPPLSSCRLS